MIEDIYRVNYMKNRFSFVGTLRNEKRFNIHDIVFISNGEDMIKCRVIGVELPIAENPEYKYKLELPKDDYKKDGDKYRNLSCKNIFSSIDEAEKSARTNLKRMFDLQEEEIERYFIKYKNK